jgi:hypothetical protein
VIRGRDVLLEPWLTPHAEPLPELSDSELRARWLVPHPWRLERIEGGGRSLVVSVTGKLSPGGVRVTETADEVSVTAYLHIVVVPIVLGRGERLWDELEALEERFHAEAVSSPSGVTHLTFTRR